MMLDFNIYDDYTDLCTRSDSDEDLIIVNDKISKHAVKGDLKNCKMGSEANLYADSCLYSRAETTLKRLRDSYNDLRIKEESITYGRSDLGPLTGRFDRACRLSKSYYFGKSSTQNMGYLNSASDYKKVSLRGLDLDCGNFVKLGDDNDIDRLTGTMKRRDDFVESLKKLFTSQLSKYGSATGSLCSMTSSDYSSNDKSGREESADESNNILLIEEDAANRNLDCNAGKEISFVGSNDFRQQQQHLDKCLPDVDSLDHDLKNIDSIGEEQLVIREESKSIPQNSERRIELDIEETMPKLNWDFLEEQLEKAIMKEKSTSSQLKDEILRKMAFEAKNDDDDEEDDGGDVTNANNDQMLADRIKIYRMSSCNYDGLQFIHPPSTNFPTSISPGVSVASTTAVSITQQSIASTSTLPFNRSSVTSVFRRPTRKLKTAGPSNRLQMCFVNEMSLEDDDGATNGGGIGGSMVATHEETLYHDEGQLHHLLQLPPSEYSTICSGIYQGVGDCDGKSLGMASQATRNSLDSSKSSLHPIPALTPKCPMVVDGEDHFFAKQARLQAEARIALAQVRPMSYMQFLLEKQAKKESCDILQYDLPGIRKWSDLRVECRLQINHFNNTHLQIIINHFLSEITSLNEELMNLLIERDDLYIIQDSMLVDIEDFTRRAEEWEYKKLIGSRLAVAPPISPSLSSSSSSSICPSPVLSVLSSLNRR